MVTTCALFSGGPRCTILQRRDSRMLGSYLVLAGVVGRISGDLGPEHTVCPHLPLLLSFLVFSPSYAPAADRGNNR